MKKLLFSLMLLCCCSMVSFAYGDKYSTDRKDLPNAAQEMLDKYFPKAKIGMIKIENDFLKKTEYDVRFTNGSEVDFNHLGEWTSVECKGSSVPNGIILEPIRAYVKSNFPGVSIIKVDKKNWGYEIELSDDVEVRFDKSGNFKGVDFD